MRLAHCLLALSIAGLAACSGSKPDLSALGDPATQTIQATYLFADGDRASVAFELSADGKTLTSTQEITGMSIATDAKRVDDRTAP